MRDGDAAKRLGPVLVGLRGSGKSACAPLVARALSMTAVDADAELERQQGVSIEAIFSTPAEGGEARFRELERVLLLDDLLQRPNIVLATGGGAVLDAEVRDALARRITIWLTAPVAVLAERIAGSARPSLTGAPIEAELEQLARERAPLYREAASLQVDTSARDAERVAALICAHYRERTTHLQHQRHKH